MSRVVFMDPYYPYLPIWESNSSHDPREPRSRAISRSGSGEEGRPLPAPREALGLDPGSRVAAVGSEGATDAVTFERVVGRPADEVA